MGVITGVVLADNGTPIAGAVVVFEDQVFTRTGADGAFTLTAPGTGQVWVRAPDGYSPAPVWAPVRADGATGVRLVLTPHPTARPLTFVHVSDLHAGVVDEPAIESALRQATAGAPPPAFVIATGDLTQGSRTDEFAAVRAAFAAIDVPVVPGLGNHDWIDNGSAYRAAMGPPAYSFDAGGVHVIVLHGNAPVADRLAFVQRDMQFTPAGTPTVAMIHYPITLPHDQALFDGLVAAGVTHLFTGHFHANRTIALPGLVEHNVQPLAMGGIQLVPAGWQTVTIDATTGAVRTTPGFVVDTPVLAVVAPSTDVCVAAGSPIIAAFADGPGPATVTAAIDGEAPFALLPTGGWDYRAEAAVPAAGEHALAVTATSPTETRTIASRFCVSPAPLQPAPATEWSQLQGSAAHTGALDAAIDPPLAVAWGATVGGFVRGSPVLAGGRLFVPVTAYGTEQRGGVVALDAATGAVLWDARDAAVDGPLAVDGQRVLAAGVDGVVRAYDAATGVTDWDLALAPELPAHSRALHAGPAVVDGAAFVGHQYAFAAVTAKDGDTRWTAIPSTAEFPSLTESTPAASADRVVAAFGSDDGVLALDRITGKQAWRYDDAITTNLEAPLALAGDHAILATSAGTVVAVDVASGDEAWRTTLVPDGFDYALWLRSSPAIADDTIYVASQRGGLFALAADGTPAWSFAPTGAGPLRTEHYSATSGAFSTAPVVTGDRIWIGGDDGVLRALDAATGAPLYALDLGAPILGGVVPALSADSSAGVLYVATWDGAVRALVTSTPDPAGALPGGNAGCGCHASTAPSLVLVLAAAALVKRRRPRAHPITPSGTDPAPA